MTQTLDSFPPVGMAVVLGASGGIGGALVTALEASGAFAKVEGLSRRRGDFDLVDELSIAALAERLKQDGTPLRCVIVATGVLHDHMLQPEKTWRSLSADTLARSFALNAIGPALVAKHILPLLPREGKSVFAALSAKVGSIGDNQLGGWYGYRAAKAALNQLLHTAAIELQRNRPEAFCVTLHPGTVDTTLSAPFHGPTHQTVTPQDAAERLLAVLDGLSPGQSGLMLDHSGAPLPW